MADLRIRDHKFNEESCASMKPETESNYDTSKIKDAQEPPLQGHTVPDYNGSDELVDVRVCDICGDVGREALLALCCKCSDGAEHIYCMRIEMDQVPEGDWMCEDCMVMQEPKRLKTAEVESADSAQNPSYLKNFTQGLPTMHSGVSQVGEMKTNPSNKSSYLSAKIPASDMEVKSPPKRRTLEKGIQPLKLSHFGRKKLSKQASLLKIMGKSDDGDSQVSRVGNRSALEVMGHRSPKPGSVVEVRPARKRISLEKCCQPRKSPASGGKSLLTGVSSLKIMNTGKGVRFQALSFGTQSSRKEIEQEISPSGHRSPKPDPQSQRAKSSSFCGGRSKMTRVSSMKIIDKGGGASFQSSSRGTQSAKKEVQQESLQSGHRSLKPESHFQPLKSSSVSERKSQLIKVSSLKIMDKGKNEHCRVSDFGNGSAKKEVEQASSPLGRKSPKAEPQSHAVSLSKRTLTNIENSTIEVRHEDICPEGKTDEGSDDHKLRKCPAKKLCKSKSFGGVSSVSTALSNCQPSHTSNAETIRYGSKRNSTEHGSSQPGLPISGFDVMQGNHSGTQGVSEIISRPHSSSNDVKNVKRIQVDENSDLQVLGSLACDGQSYENKIAGESAQKAELGCSSRAEDNQFLPMDLHPVKNPPALTSADMDPSGIYAVPESECIWKGAFHRLEIGGELPNYCGGIQAHLSTSASSKVLELIPKFNPELRLKEVPRLNTWPLQFEKNCPTEQDIALYFFSEDLLSHARSYTMLLEGMIRDDLALEANLDGVQLLVFPSNLLPVRSQRWNRLLFLWGVFRVKKVDNYSIQISCLNAATLNEDLCTPVTHGALKGTLCASKGGSFSASQTSYNSTKGPEFVDPTVQFSSSTKSMDQNFEHEEVSSAGTCLGIQGTEDQLGLKDDSTTFDNDRINKEILPNTVLHSNDFQIEDAPDGYSNPKTHIFPYGWSYEENMVCVSKLLQEEKRLDVISQSSFSIDSGPSGSSNGAGCSKSDEGQVEQFEDPSNRKALNLELSLRPPLLEPEGGQVDLDLVLGSRSTSKYKTTRFSKDRSSEHRNVSLFLSLGLPCSNGG